MKKSKLAQPNTAIRVEVQPKAARSEILGFRGDVLHVKVTAPPEKGKANEALLKLLAEALGVPRTRIRVLRGHTSRYKSIAVDCLSQGELYRRLRGEQPI